MTFLAPFLRIDAFALFIGGFSVFFFVLAVIYSIPFMRGNSGNIRYYFYLVLTLLASLGVIFADQLVFFLVFWGFLGLLLYLLIGFGKKERAAKTAQKALIIVGGTDALMILGLGLIFSITGGLQMSGLRIPLDSPAAILAYLCLAAGALAKAGSMPFHSWVPDTAADAPIPVTAFLPASLDKLLGIYFLARLSLQVFVMTPAMNTVLMVVGSVTIVLAVMMALVQHDLKRLLGYHAVSQVGYMVLGIGTGTLVGVAGGLFHMLNHAIYKSSLFFCGGSVEKETGTTDLDKLGGLSKSMPITFIAFLVSALAISGVPPLNGFASKWMIYQGIIETSRNGGHLWIVWLVSAMFGSALTLASFMKVMNAVFLGQPSVEEAARNPKKETSPFMWGPTVILAALCLIFGIFAVPIPLNRFIFPSLGVTPDFSGIWQPGLATALFLAALGIGFLIYFIGNLFKARETPAFIGGETLAKNPEMRVSGTEFYLTVQNFGPLKSIYRRAEARQFDPYEIGIRSSAVLTHFLRRLHNGILPTYLAWCLLGASILLLVLFLR